MKNRKIVIVAFLLIAALCLGIGYAVEVSDDLAINGNVSYDLAEVQETFDANVHFANEEVDGGVTVTYEDEYDTLNITMDNTVFTQVGDSTVITVDVVNESLEMDATINVDTPAVVEAYANFFKVEVTAAPTTVAAGGSAQYEITVTMIDWPKYANGDDMELTEVDLFSIALNATYAG